jgi:small GTP-binding protein
MKPQIGFILVSKERTRYETNSCWNIGRVDHGSAFLDTFSIERARGITVFSKQAILRLPEGQATLLDTPGHVDFSPEMERTLDVLDCAILVVSGAAGVQSHTHTVWKLLRRRGIPTFIFVNKMDLPGADRTAVLAELRQKLDDNCVDFTSLDPERLAECDEPLLEEYLSTGAVTEARIAAAISRCRILEYFGAFCAGRPGRQRFRRPGLQDIPG